VNWCEPNLGSASAVGEQNAGAHGSWWTGRFIISTGETCYTFCVFLNLVLVLLVVRVGFPIVSDWNNNPRAGKYEHTHTTDKLKAIPHHFVPFSFQHVGQHLGLHPQTYRSRSTLLTHTHTQFQEDGLCVGGALHSSDKGNNSLNSCSGFYSPEKWRASSLFLHSQPLDYHHYRRAVSNVLCENGGPCERGPLLIEMNWIDRAVPKQPLLE
jgi:hypothetical protein